MDEADILGDRIAIISRNLSSFSFSLTTVDFRRATEMLWNVVVPEDDLWGRLCLDLGEERALDRFRG